MLVTQYTDLGLSVYLRFAISMRKQGVPCARRYTWRRRKMGLEAIRYDASAGRLQILNQLLLPSKSEYEEVACVEDAWKAIKEMKVIFSLLIISALP